MENGRLHIIRNYNNEIIESVLDWDVKRIQLLTNDTFLVQEKHMHEIKKLTFKYEGSTPY